MVMLSAEKISELLGEEDEELESVEDIRNAKEKITEGFNRSLMELSSLF